VFGEIIICRYVPELDVKYQLAIMLGNVNVNYRRYLISVIIREEYCNSSKLQACEYGPDAFVTSFVNFLHC
jgi:hypothetical protein